eukprot:UN06820
MELTLRRQERGPVTACCSVRGVLALAVGSKIMLYKFTGETLIPCAYFDVGMYTLNR